MNPTPEQSADATALVKAAPVIGEIVESFVPPADIRDRVELAILGVDEDCTLDDARSAIILLDAVADWAKQQKALLMDRLKPFIERNGSFNIGPLIYYLGTTKKDPKCVDLERTLKELMKSALVIDKESGEEFVDYSIVTTCLSTNAFKPATTKKQLPLLADELFKVPPVAMEVKIDGPKAEKPVKSDQPTVKVFNEDFIR